jgi:hypothetical protein
MRYIRYGPWGQAQPPEKGNCTISQNYCVKELTSDGIYVMTIRDGPVPPRTGSAPIPQKPLRSPPLNHTYPWFLCQQTFDGK